MSLSDEDYKNILSEYEKKLKEPKKPAGVELVDVHDEISAHVFRRLHFRYALLRELLELTKKSLEGREKCVQLQYESILPNLVNKSDKPPPSIAESSEKSSSTVKINEQSGKGDNSTTQVLKFFKEAPLQFDVLADHIAVTDLFVEKALAYLEDAADKYQKKGYKIYTISFWVVGIGSIIAIGAMIYRLILVDKSLTWLDLLSSFIRTFTAYGMIVLLAVGLWRYASAMLDQAERLFERRHALRQGRLFVHLNDGKLTIDEMEKAFNWNVSQTNAFGRIPTDAQAPLGAISKTFTEEMGKIISTAVQAAITANVGKVTNEQQSPRSSQKGDS